MMTRFQWMDARENHTAVLCDEFDIRDFANNIGEWEKAVEGSSFKADNKHKSPIELTMNHESAYYLDQPLPCEETYPDLLIFIHVIYE